MGPVRGIVARVRALWRRDVITDEISDELQFHLEQRIEELEARGLSRAEARRVASKRFGNVHVLRDQGYDIRGGGFMETVVKDVRFGLHLLRRRPSYSISAVLTLALGIGLTTTLLSIIDAAWLRPLPFPSPEQLVRLHLTADESSPDMRKTTPSLDDIRSLRAATQVLDGIGQWIQWEERLVLDDGEPERVRVLTMSEGYADLYGVPMVIGRTFRLEDARPGAPAVVLLSHAYWRQRFNADPAVIGRSVLVGNVARTVIGVLPPSLHRNTQMWVPESRSELEQERNSGADVYARVKAGVSLPDAERILGEIAAGWPVTPRMPRITGAELEPLYDETIASTSDAMSMIVVSALVLVALVCVNVAGLIFADGTERRREFAVRSSMGAGRGRLVRQLVTEAAVLGTFATAVGIVVASWSLSALVSILPIEFAPHSGPMLNARVLAMAVVASASIIGANTLWPAWSLTRTSLNDILSGAAQQQSRPWPRSFGRGIIATEVALATVLLTSGGLLMRSMDRLLKVDLGFTPGAFLTMEVTPLDQSPAVWTRYFPQALEAIRRVPGVAAAGAVDGMPLASNAVMFMAMEEGSPLGDAATSSVTPGYLEALGVQVLAGRTFREEDRGNNVVVLDASLARRVFPDREAVGQTVSFGGPTAPLTIIGVVSNIRHSAKDTGPTLYMWLTPHVMFPPTMVIRAAEGARISHDALRAAAHSLGTRVLVERIRPGSDLLDESLSIPRHRMTLLSLLGGLGLLLTLIGTAGVTAYAVARRTHEVGVRLTFGATPHQVVRAITFETLRPIAIGLVVGLAGATYTTALISAFLFQVPEFDPFTVSVVVVILGLATLVAAWLPARRAARVDPVQALRTE